MDVYPSPQPCAVGEDDKNQTENKYGCSYADALTSGNHSAEEVSKLELCPVSLENGIPTVEFTVEDVNSFTREEGLHQAVVIKFSHGKPAIQELRQILPKHFEVKGCYSIGQLEFCHILVRFDLFKDFAKVVSRSSGYVQSKGDTFFFRTFPWTMGFNPREETSKAVVWISFPNLPANLFARKSLMSIASAVGKPITVDKATKYRTRPSTARVKVLINILDKHPNKIKIKIFDTKTGKMVENDQQIVIDNLPQYCTLCNYRDHDVKSCRWNTEVDIGKIPLFNDIEGRYSLYESGRDAREFLNEINASRRYEINTLSVTANAQKTAEIDTSKKTVEPDITKKTVEPVEPDTTKKTVSLKSTSLAVFKNSIANSKFETGSISSFKVQNAQQKNKAKQWRVVHHYGTNANADAVSDLSVLEVQNPETNKIADVVKIVQQNNDPLIGLTVVTDNFNLGSWKAAETSKVSEVSKATKSVRTMKEVLDSQSMPAIINKSDALVLDHATSSIQLGHLFDLARQSDNKFSKLKDNISMDTSNRAVILKVAKAVEFPKAAVQERNLNEVLGSHSRSIASDHRLLDDHIRQAEGTVPLDEISKGEENSISHPAVLEILNAANSPNVSVLHQATDQQIALKEIGDSQPTSITSEKPSAIDGQSGNTDMMLVTDPVPFDLTDEDNTDHFVLSVEQNQKSAVSTTKDNTHKTGQRASSRGLDFSHLLESDQYGNLIDLSGKSNLLLSTSKHSIALVPVVNDNSENLVNKNEVAAVTQKAVPQKENEINHVTLDTIAKNKQGSSHHGKDAAINSEHSENASKHQKTRHHRETNNQSESSQQNKSKLQQRATEQEEIHAGKAAGREFRKARRYPPIYSGEETFPFETSISSNKKEEMSWDAVFSNLNANTSLFDTIINAKVEHCQRERCWDGKMIEDDNIRRPPMRKAKQKQVDHRIRSNSKNKV